MRTNLKKLKLLTGLVYISKSNTLLSKRCYHGLSPVFLDFYKNTTGQSISEDKFKFLKKKHPNLENLTHDRLQCTLQILDKFGITPLEACQHLHVFSMHPITMDNYGEILKECCFVNVTPQHIIRYHTVVRLTTIAKLKKEGLLRQDLVLEEVLLDKLQEWPAEEKTLQVFHDSNTTILNVRMSVLQRYLHWKLAATTEDFEKFCRHYLPLRHKPLVDIQEALNIAQSEFKFDNVGIRRNGFLISSDPLQTKLILENVRTLAGLDIRDAIRKEPAILKNNYNSIIQVRDILEEYRITQEAQRRCLKVFCMTPETVRERLNELMSLKEYQVFSTNPRVLSMVVHKKKMLDRLSKIQQAKKQCYSLNHFVSASRVFNNYINNFGDKVCGRDIAILISSSLDPRIAQKEAKKIVLNELRRHKYWLHVALDVIDANIKFLKNKFEDRIIFDNCQILLYPVSEVRHHINILLQIRSGDHKRTNLQDYLHYNNLNSAMLTDNQILSLVLYEIEKKYHFSGDGIWSRLDGVKQSVN